MKNVQKCSISHGGFKFGGRGGGGDGRNSQLEKQILS